MAITIPSTAAARKADIKNGQTTVAADTWEQVTLPSWVVRVEVQNPDAVNDLRVAYEATGTWAADDDGYVIAPGNSQLLPLAVGSALAKAAPTFWVNSAGAAGANFKLLMLGA